MKLRYHFNPTTRAYEGITGMYPEDGPYPMATTAVAPPALGAIWNGSTWDLEPPAPPAPVYPVLDFTFTPVVTDVQNDYRLVETAKVIDISLRFAPGHKLSTHIAVTFAGHVLNGQDGFPDYNHIFRLPIQPVNYKGEPAGNPIYKTVNFTHGEATVEFEPKEPTRYDITQAIIAHDLEEGEMVLLPKPIRITGVE